MKKEAYVKGQLDSTKYNSFTNDEIKDEYDLKIYQLQQKIKENGGDPIEDLAKEMAKLEREKANQKSKEEQSKKEQEEKAKRDYKEIKEKYPKLDVADLLKNKNFELYARARVEKDSLLTIYEDYLALKKSFEENYAKEQEEKESKEKAKKESTTPGSSSLRSKTNSKYSSLTPEQRIEILKKQGYI